MLTDHATSAYITQHLGQNDVLCGRDKEAFNNPGNLKFRVTIDNHLSDYINAPSRKAKSLIIQAIAEWMKQMGGRFLKKKKSNDSTHAGVIYTELSKKQAYEKIGHALRDMALANKKSGKTTSAISSLGRKIRALLGKEDNDASHYLSKEGISPQQPAQSPTSSVPDVACFQQQPPEKDKVHSTRTQIERTPDSIVPPKPFCQTMGPLKTSGLPMSISSGHRSGKSTGAEQAAIPSPIPFVWRTSNTTIGMSPEETDILVSCLNSNKSTSSVSSMMSNDTICPSKEELDVLLANVTRSSASTTSSCSLIPHQSINLLESPVTGHAPKGLPDAPVPAVMHSWDSLPWDEKMAFMYFLTPTSSSSTGSAVTFSSEACKINNTSLL